jgi:hypothetical protein
MNALKSKYWLLAHFRAQVLMFHHLQQLALSFIVSQKAPGKVFPSLSMEYRIIPVSPTGTKYILHSTDVIGQFLPSTDVIRMA